MNKEQNITTKIDNATWGILENKTNATTLPNIGSVKTANEEEWNKMSEEFILKACKSLRSSVDTIIEKKKMVAILNKFIVLCLSSYFAVYFFKIKINLILIVYYHTNIFLIFLPRPVINLYKKKSAGSYGRKTNEWYRNEARIKKKGGLKWDLVWFLHLIQKTSL